MLSYLSLPNSTRKSREIALAKVMHGAWCLVGAGFKPALSQHTRNWMEGGLQTRPYSITVHR